MLTLFCVAALLGGCGSSYNDWLWSRLEAQKSYYAHLRKSAHIGWVDHNQSNELLLNYLQDRGGIYELLLSQDAALEYEPKAFILNGKALNDVRELSFEEAKRLYAPLELSWYRYWLIKAPQSNSIERFELKIIYQNQKNKTIILYNKPAYLR